MLFWWLSVAALCLAALGDGITTTQGIKSGKAIEGNKFLDWIYRTNTPSAAQTFGIGFSIIGAEVLFGYEMIRHNVGDAAGAWPYAALIQAAFHTYCIFSNYKLNTGKSLL